MADINVIFAANAEALTGAIEKVHEGFGDLSKDLLGFGVRIAGITSAFDFFKESLVSAAKAESLEVSLKAIIEDGEKAEKVIEGLHRGADETATSFLNMGEAAASLAAAGVPAEKLAESTKNLAEISKVLGVPLANISELYERILTKGEVTMRELIRLSIATGGATRELARELGFIPTQISLITQAYDLAEKAERHAFASQEKSISGINDILGKHLGIAQEVFDQWSRSDKAMQGMGMMPRILKGAHFPNIQDERAHVKEFTDQFADGLKEIQKETGLDEKSVRNLVRTHNVGFEELTKYAQKYREEQQRLKEEEFTRKKEAIKTDAEVEKFNILEKVKATLTANEELNKKAEEHARTTAGQWERSMHALEKMKELLGAQLLTEPKATTPMGAFSSQLNTWLEKMLGGETFWKKLNDKIGAGDKPDGTQKVADEGTAGKVQELIDLFKGG